MEERRTIEIENRRSHVPFPAFRTRAVPLELAWPCRSIILHCRTSMKKVVPTNQGHRVLCSVSRLSSRSTDQLSALSALVHTSRESGCSNDFSTARSLNAGLTRRDRHLAVNVSTLSTLVNRFASLRAHNPNHHPLLTHYQHNI